MVTGRTIRAILLAVGLLLLGYLVRRVGVDQLRTSLTQIGWGFAVLFLLGGVSHLVKTMAWRTTFPDDSKPRIGWLFCVRVIGESVSQLSFAGQVFGETTKAAILRSVVSLSRGVSTVVLDRAVFTLSGTVVILLALVTLPFLAGFGGHQQVPLLAGAGVFVLLSVLVLTALRRGWPFLSGPVRLFARLRSSEPTRVIQQTSEIEQRVQVFMRDSPGRFRVAFALNCAGHLLSVVEVFLVLRLLSVDATFAHAVVIEGLTKVVNLVGFVIPGNIGAYEAGNMMILRLLSLDVSAGFTLGLTRRIRGLSWTMVGLVLFAVLPRFQGREMMPASTGTALETESKG